MPSFLTLSPISPKSGLPSTADYVKAMKQAAQKTANLARRDLQSTVSTWKPEHKPDFKVSVSQVGQEYAVAAGTDDPLYNWVDQGTKPHIIRPRRYGFLQFRVGGRPKTRVGVIGSQAGMTGTDWRRAFFVLHPGTARRDFTGKIQSRRQKTMEQETSQALAKLARKSK